MLYMNFSPFSGDSIMNEEDIVVFSNISHDSMTQNSIVLVAKTSNPVICEVEYAEYQQETNFASDVDTNNAPHLEHRIVLSNLNSDKRYNYQFQAMYEGTKFYSDIRTFTTSS